MKNNARIICFYYESEFYCHCPYGMRATHIRTHTYARTLVECSKSGANVEHKWCTPQSRLPLLHFADCGFYEHVVLCVHMNVCMCVHILTFTDWRLSYYIVTDAPAVRSGLHFLRKRPYALVIYNSETYMCRCMLHTKVIPENYFYTKKDKEWTLNGCGNFSTEITNDSKLLSPDTS